jgi:hypothetical protein
MTVDCYCKYAYYLFFLARFMSLHQAVTRADASHIDPFAAQLKQRHEIALSFQKAFNAQLMHPGFVIIQKIIFIFNIPVSFSNADRVNAVLFICG